MKMVIWKNVNYTAPRKFWGVWFMVVAVLVIISGLILWQRRQEQTRIPKREVGTDVYALEEEVRNVLGQECVTISTDRSSGSGMLWSYDGEKLLVVTAGHLIEKDFSFGELELWSGEKLRFSEADVQVYPDVDVAVIELCSRKTEMQFESGQSNESDMTVYVDVENLRQIKGGVGKYISEVQPVVGDTVWVVDSVYGPASRVVSCQVYAAGFYLEDYGLEMLLVSCQGMAGMSGSPVYDEEGRLIAMVSGMSEDGSILAAIPVAKYSAKH